MLFWGELFLEKVLILFHGIPCLFIASLSIQIGSLGKIFRGKVLNSAWFFLFLQQKTAVVTITSAQKPTTTVITAGARVQPAPQTVLKPSVTPQSPSTTTTSAAAPANRAPVLSQVLLKLNSFIHNVTDYWWIWILVHYLL